MSKDYQQLSKYTEYKTIVITLPVTTINALYTLALPKQESISEVVERLAREELRRKEDAQNASEQQARHQEEIAQRRTQGAKDGWEIRKAKEEMARKEGKP